MSDPAAHVVLVVDDDGRVRAALSTLLRGASYRTEVASNGEQGFQVLCKTPIDVVLTDLVMPSVDGLELIRLVRRDPFLMHVPIIAMTPFGSAGEAQAKEAGATTCADQPVRGEQVLALVQLVLDVLNDRRHEQPNEVAAQSTGEVNAGAVVLRAPSSVSVPRVVSGKAPHRKSGRVRRPLGPSATHLIKDSSPLAEEAIAAGRVADAEALLCPELESLLVDARAGRLASDAIYNRAIRQALLLAHASRRGRYVDYIIDLEHTRNAVPSRELLGELKLLATEVDGVSLKAVRQYLSAIRGMPATLESARAARELQQLIEKCAQRQAR